MNCAGIRRNSGLLVLLERVMQVKKGGGSPVIYFPCDLYSPRVTAPLPMVMVIVI